MMKYILPFMSIALLMAMASCSSSDDAVAEIKEESKLVPMTFTATQESNVGTRTALSTGNSVIWKTGDKISVFDGEKEAQYNHEFTLSSGDGSTSGSFTGEVLNTSTNFFAVYPYTEGATMKFDVGSDAYHVKDITLPAEQTAYNGSFDPNAALMIAKSSDKNTFNFLNVVSLVKVTTEFACKSIVLNANEDIAGTGNLGWDETNPSISFTSNTSKSIVLKPQEGQDEIAAGTYYIAVKPRKLTSGWSISFTSTDYNVYTRKANSAVTFNRGKIRSIGTFKTDGSTSWTSTSRGSKVQANQEVDLGLTITKDSKKYRVIFAKYNLTKESLAAKESDFGDYFAWGAIEPWYTAYTRPTATEVTPTEWKTGKESGYTSSNCPSYDNDDYVKDGVLKMEYDPARQILGGDWQLPTKEIWQALYKTDNYNLGWTTQDGYNGRKVTSKTDNSKSIFLPAAGEVDGTSFSYVGSYGYYWSGPADSSSYSYGLYFDSVNVPAQYYYSRYKGFSVRPVRLVAVD